ncbi:DUF262 domain-containing protein [Fusobacterium necrogenes]|uniref:DUF262 domain-containing protein n=1 Tax=Fusobacterium necrogenes TaxID=858 RepID=UPI00255CCEDC|nr:DUF262 domain-containing HNH endonuclease family protein [Fusobacterium necrogenes]
MSFKEMILEKKIYVPNYQRAYSWEIARENEKKKRQADLFLEDVMNHVENEAKVKENFYLGNFLYERDGEKFAIIDGQQRLTTIIILLSVLNNLLKNEELKNIIDFNNIKFSTVKYDNEDFQKYIFSNELNKFNNLKEFRESKVITNTESIRRVIEAYLYFKDKLVNETVEKLKKLAETITQAKCTMNTINSKVEATQIFIFENNRGKSPTNLEITKTKLMYFIYNNFEKNISEILLKEVDNTFGEIYKKITTLENYINEDTVLAIAIRMYKQNLRIDGVLTEVDNMLIRLKPQKNDDNVEITEKEENKEKIQNEIKKFLNTLKDTFEKVDKFITKGLAKSKELDFNDEYEYVAHSLINLGISVQLYPIVLKSLELGEKERVEVLKALEKIILRNLIIKTRANLSQRFYDRFQNTYPHYDKEKEKTVQESIFLVVERIQYLLLTQDSWWNYWNQKVFNEELENGLTNLHATRYLLWKYENFLRKKDNMVALKYTEIKNYQVEHISPKTENTKENNGYDKLEWNILNSYGNLMLLTQETNVKIQNKNLREKLEAYEKETKDESNEKVILKQQLEVITEIKKDGIFWGKEKIKNRNEDLLKFIKNHF